MKTIAVVTGASSGLGRECVRYLSRNPEDMEEIWAVARSEEKLLKLKEETKGIPVRAIPLDLSDPADRNRLSLYLKKELPSVRMLVNAAGFGRIGRAGAYPEEESGMIRLNCEALTLVTGMMLPYMKKGAGILQFASAAAFLPQPDFAVYAATKAYVLSYTRALAAELSKKKIKVTAVCPGPVETAFFSRAGGISKIPFYKRIAMAKPEHVVRRAFLDLRSGKHVSVYGGKMKMFRIFCSVLPHELILSVFAMLLPGGKEK